MPGPMAFVVALMAPWVVSLAGTTLPLAVAVAALSRVATVSFAVLPCPQPAPMNVAMASAAVENRRRISRSRCRGSRKHRPERRVCAGARLTDQYRGGALAGFFPSQTPNGCY